MNLGPVIHTPVRLQVVSLLAAATEADFSFVRGSLEIGDSLLSEHTSALENAGYAHIRKGHVGKRPRTWLNLTGQGRAAFAEYVAARQQIVGQPLAPAGMNAGQTAVCLHAAFRRYRRLYR
ncbi:transcriptional regulator [Actinomadura sp. NPDC048394]|uniref:winged helix-turn-helix domain-containing protein n=1 Tax=Actinomadura sp. NPDC048394 TaxID=3158223 RepID=UPI0033C08D9C